LCKDIDFLFLYNFFAHAGTSSITGPSLPR